MLERRVEGEGASLEPPASGTVQPWAERRGGVGEEGSAAPASGTEPRWAEHRGEERAARSVERRGEAAAAGVSGVEADGGEAR